MKRQTQDYSSDTDFWAHALAKIENFDFCTEIEQIGEVIGIGDGVATVKGLSGCMINEMLRFDNGETGLALNLSHHTVGVVVLGPYERIQEGDLVYRTGRVLEVPVGDELVGRVVNVLGEPLDEKGAINPDDFYPIENTAPDVMSRTAVREPLATGLTAVDALVPIGRGQRELIIGDRKTGKTTLALDAIINQADQDVLCIYVAIGQKESTIKEVIGRLSAHGAMSYTTVVVASSSDPTAVQYIAPYAGCAMAEYQMRKGRAVLIVYDDLSKQAVAYRELSLLLKRPPGREAYPGDVFYLHARLLERAAKLNAESGGGSMTALPIIETQFGDVSAYIPTNVISITDGQIFLESHLFHSGQRPAVNVGISVSRVGGSAQIKAMKQIAGRLRLDLAQYRELLAFTQFGSDLDPVTQKSLKKGKIMMQILCQKPFRPIPTEEQVVLIFAGQEGYLDEIPARDLARALDALRAFFRKSENRSLLSWIKNGGTLDEEHKKHLERLLNQFRILAPAYLSDQANGHTACNSADAKESDDHSSSEAVTEVKAAVSSKEHGYVG